MRRLLATTPFMAIALPLVVGIVAARYVWFSPLLMVVAVLIFFIAGAMMVVRNRLVAYVYIASAIFVLGLLLASVVAPPHRGVADIPIASGLQDAAAERLSRLELSDDNMAVVSAMSIGVKEHISYDLRRDYSRVGASHILAVSGLHVGMVFILVNILIFFLPLFTRNGHVWKHVAAVALIWLYALVAGASPSVVRAALMFSFGQMAVAMTRTRSVLNVILAAATIMLCINPHYLYDLSFQLSYAATLSIVLFAAPVGRYLKCRNRVGNAFTQLIVVSLAASLGTAPLIAWYFGSLPLIGLVVNIPVVLLAHVIVLLSLVWVIAPIGWLTTPVGALLEWVVSAQNGIVSSVAQHPWAAYAVEMSGASVALCYGLLIVAAALLNRKNSYLCADDND